MNHHTKSPLTKSIDHRRWVCSKCGKRATSDCFREWLNDCSFQIYGPCICEECRQSRPEDYERRNRFLKILGFNSYSHYLRSEMWASVRQMVSERDKGRCAIQGCCRTGCDIHHNSYEIDVLVGNDLSQLIILCRHHHEESEFDENNKKRSLPEVREHLKSLGLEIPELVHEKPPKNFVPRHTAKPTKFKEYDRLISVKIKIKILKTMRKNVHPDVRPDFEKSIRVLQEFIYRLYHKNLTSDFMRLFHKVYSIKSKHYKRLLDLNPKCHKTPTPKHKVPNNFPCLSVENEKGKTHTILTTKSIIIIGPNGRNCKPI